MTWYLPLLLPVLVSVERQETLGEAQPLSFRPTASVLWALTSLHLMSAKVCQSPRDSRLGEAGL